MKLRNVSVLVVFMSMFLIIIGCEKAEKPIVIKDFGPTKTKAGQVFNVQPNGESAIWVAAENATLTTAIVWGERRLGTTKEPYGASALVPKDLYAKPGQYQIYLLDTKTGAKSNRMVFTVEE